MSSNNVRSVLIVAAIAAVIGVSFIGVKIMAEGATTDTGVSIAIPTAPRPEVGGCRLGLVAGTLVVHPDWVVALGGGGEPQLVFWPYGWSARQTDEGADLLDEQGRVVARTGDEVRGSGGLASFRGREGINVCPTDLHFEPPDE